MNFGLDIQSCIARKNYTGTLTICYDEDEEYVGIPYVTFSSPVKAELKYEIFEDDSVDITGSVTFSLKGLCSRCLSETETEVTGEVDACFLPGGDDGENYGYHGGKLDLREALRDAVIAAMPLKLTCKKECELPEYKED